MSESKKYKKTIRFSQVSGDFESEIEDEYFVFNYF